MRTSEEHIDNMLFNYLEGNLSDDKAQQVEREITSDPLIEGELNLWKQSFVHADFYNTTTIEPQLLQSPGSFGFTFFLNSILVVCIALISSTNPKINPISTSHQNNQIVKVLEPREPQSLVSNKQIAVVPILMRNTASFVTTSKNERRHETESVVYASISAPEISRLVPASTDYIIKHPKSMKIGFVKKDQILTKKDLRKNDRELRRWKKKIMREYPM